MSNYSIFDFFNKHQQEKFFHFLDTIIPQDQAKEIIVSQNFETILLNNKFLLEQFKLEKVLISFIEKTSPKNYQVTSNHLIFLFNSDQNTVRNFVSFVNEFCSQHQQPDLNFYLVALPRRDFLTNLYIKKNLSSQIQQRVKLIGDFDFDFYPLDDDLYTIGYDQGFQEILQQEHLYLQHVAENLKKFELLFGDFKAADQVGQIQQIIQQMQQFDQEDQIEKNKNSFVDFCLIFDRRQDMLTPLLTQFSYTGLVDELYHIKNNTIKERESIINNSISQNFINFYMKNDQDKVYKQLKDLNFTKFMNELRKMITELSQINIKETQFENYQESKQIADKIKNKPYIELHLRISKIIDQFLKQPLLIEKIRLHQIALSQGINQGELIEQLDYLIESQVDYNITLNILFLLNIIFHGFTEQQFVNLQQKFIISYGIQMTKILLYYQKIGLFVNRSNQNQNFHIIRNTNFQQKQKDFNLINTQFNINDDNDISNIYSGYKPISINQIEQKILLEINKKVQQKIESILVFFVGGVTYGEIACLRSLSRILNKTILIGTTNIINSNSFNKIIKNSQLISNKKFSTSN